MNEVEIGLPLNERLWSILENRLPRSTAIIAATTAHRFSGQDARAHGIVCELCRQLRRDAPLATEIVRHCEHGHTVRLTVRAA